MQGYDYEVFLSFRGPDTRTSITDHLYTCLIDAGVRAYRDDEELRIGKDIGPDLLGAIEQSKISIPIFSKDYASSVWCLKELAQMVECRKRKGQLIMPIFYHVEPSEVRHQTGGYGEAFYSYEKKKRFDDETIRNWRAALHEVGALKGWDVTESVRREGAMVKEVVTDVLKVLKKYIVGIEDHVERVMKLLKVESSGVRVVGIHGIGGTGKTTIAKSIYKRVSHLFDGCSFLESVRENAKKPGGLVNLQGQLISDLLGEMHRQTRSVDDGAKSIRSRFLHKKLLIVLDDIEPGFRFLPILGSLDWLGSGSRILISTRDERALNDLGVTLKHEVGEMTKDDALELFHAQAFGERPVPEDFAAPSQAIISTINRLPLAIEVVGSYLNSKSKVVWEETLKELGKVRERQVEQKLIVIINALPEEQRKIFLDIACFFVGEDKSVAFYLWSDHGSANGVVLKVLVLWSIVKIENNKL